MWSRRGLGRVCASALLTAGLPAVRAQTPTAAVNATPIVRAPLGRVVLAVDHKASFCYLPLTIAERLGYFAVDPDTNVKSSQKSVTLPVLGADGRVKVESRQLPSVIDGWVFNRTVSLREDAKKD